MSYLWNRRKPMGAALAIGVALFALALVPLRHAHAALAGIPDSVQPPLQNLQFGDFDGDGKADVFQVVGVQWQFSSGGAGQWQNLATSSAPLNDLRFGDFNGDKKTDVFSIDGNQWRYSSRGADPWTNLTTSTVPLTDLRFADFNGDLKTDVFNVDGTQWRYSSGGVTGWVNLASSSVPFAELRIGDFDGDGIADLFNSTGSQWRFSSGGVASWQNLLASDVPLTELRFGDFDGDKKADVFSIDGTQWRYSAGGAGAWQNLAVSDVALTELRFGDFDGDKKTDVFTILDGRWAFSSGGLGPWQYLGPPAPPTPATPGTPVSPTAPPGTPTTMPPVTPIPPSGNCTNLIMNGDFEMDGHWTYGRSPSPATIVGGERYSGQRSLQMGIVPPGGNQASYSSIRQPVAIPANATVAELRWARLARSEEPPTETPSRQGDRQEVLLLGPTGETLAIVQRIRRNENGWRQDGVDLSAFRGQNVHVYFNVYNDGAGGRTWMHLDDVMLNVCFGSGGGGPGPWPMPQPMPMPPPGGGPPMHGSPMPPGPSTTPMHGSPMPPGPSTTPVHGSPMPPQPSTTPRPTPSAEYVEALVTGVSDGDTIQVAIAGEPFTVRYIGLRAPELGEPFGPDAAALNQKLVGGKLVYLQQDVTDVDQFGRLPRYVFLDDGAFVNEEMVRQGLAMTDLAAPDLAYASLLLQAQQQAQTVGNGMWTPAIPSIAPSQALTEPVAAPAQATEMPAAETAVATAAPTSEPATPAPTRTVRTEPAQAEVCTNLLNNGDFEAPSVGWTLVGVESPPTYVTSPTFGGSLYAMQLGIAAGMPNTAGTSAISQDVALPSNASEIVLSFRYWPSYDGTPGAGDLQYADVYLASTDRFIGRALGVQANRDQWLMSQYDLTPFAGQTVRLFFGVNNDGVDGRMAMVVDNVTVSACRVEATSDAAVAAGLASAAGSPATARSQPVVTELAAQAQVADAPAPAGRGSRAAVLAGVVAAGVALSAMVFSGRRALG